MFGSQGFFLEEDLDKKGIPETKEQKEKRARGQKVKAELLAEWRHGFSWDNHELATQMGESGQEEGEEEEEGVMGTAVKIGDIKTVVPGVIS